MDRNEERNYDTALQYIEWSRDRIKELEDECSAAEDTASALKEENTRMSVNEQQLERELALANRTIDALESDIADLKKHIEDLNSQLTNHE